ncbi:MAG: TIGR01458 family HAD-type hydrolase [Gaiellaceae bacterium]
MAAILIDIDGVLHVSNEPISGATGAVRRLREAGHRLRFLTNNTTRPRSRLIEELRAMGFEIDENELQTTPRAAARVLAGRRVLALTMSAIVEDLEGIELVGEGADAVLLGGADETEESGRVFSYMNLARAFAELEAGAELFCLHRNRWWQTKHGPLLDSGAFVAGLEYAAETHATVLGKPSSLYFAAALETLDSDPGQALMVGDDIESDIRGAQLHGMRTVLVRTGKFRPDTFERSGIRPTALLSSIADFPEWLATAR